MGHIFTLLLKSSCKTLTFNLHLRVATHGRAVVQRINMRNILCWLLEYLLEFL